MLPLPCAQLRSALTDGIEGKKKTTCRLFFCFPLEKKKRQEIGIVTILLPKDRIVKSEFRALDHEIKKQHKMTNKNSVFMD